MSGFQKMKYHVTIWSAGDQSLESMNDHMMKMADNGWRLVTAQPEFNPGASFTCWWLFWEAPQP